MRLLRLDPDKQRALFVLRRTLTLRAFSRDTGRIVGLLLAVGLLGPAALLAGFGSWFGYQRMEPEAAASLMSVILSALWAIWLVGPLLSYNLNEGLDLSRLLIYPLTRRDLVVSQLLGTIWDYQTYLMVPLFVAILLAWGGGASLLLVLVALGLTWAHLMIGSQLLLVALGGILNNRRFRDTMLIIMSVVGASCYLVQRALFEFGERGGFRGFNPHTALQWLPPGAAARAIAQASGGEWGGAVTWLLYSAALLLLVAWLWSHLLGRLLVMGEFQGFQLRRAAPRTAPVRRPTTPAVERLLGWLPPDLRHLAAKEVRTVWRVPQRRIALIQNSLSPLFLVAFFLLGDSEESRLWLGLLIPVYGLLSFWGQSADMLGWEMEGLPTLLLTPVPRRRIFLAKGLVLGSLSLPPMLLLGGLLLVLDPTWVVGPGFLAGVGAGLAVMGLNCLTSVLLPVPIRLSPTTNAPSPKGHGSFFTGLLRATAVPGLTFLTALPAVLPLLLAVWRVLPWLGWVGGGFALIYGPIVFWLGSRFAAQALLQRESHVLQAITMGDRG